MANREHAVPAPDPPDVTVELSSRDVILPWSTREALLAALREHRRGDDELARATRTAVEDVASGSPVLLTLEHKMYVLRLLEEWSRAAGGYDALPPGLFELRNAVLDDLRDAERRQASG